MFKQILKVCAVLALGLPAAVAHAELNVVTTLPSLAALAQEVGGERVTVTAMASSAEDPHYVDARPSMMVTLNKADMLLINGMELEVGWLPGLITSARNPDINVGGKGYVDVSQFVRPLDVPTGKLDRAQGDVHAAGNPHYLFDPRVAAQIAVKLGDRMAALDPESGAEYTANAKAAAQRLQTFAAAQRERFAELEPSQRRVVSYHKSLTYLFDWLGLEEVSTVEPKPGIPPNPAHVAKVLGAMRSSKVHVIIQEKFYPTNTSQQLAKLAGGQVVVIPGGVDVKAGESYVHHITQIADGIFDALD